MRRDKSRLLNFSTRPRLRDLGTNEAFEIIEGESRPVVGDASFVTAELVDVGKRLALTGS